jgi:ABC-type amino acid transport substrate-binding protein
LNTGVVRIGIARVAAAFPIIYTTIGDDPTKLDLGSLSGIEIEEAREAVRRISDFYDTPIEIEFVIIEPFEGDVFFGPLSAALLAGEIDLTWSRMGVTAERAQVVDFSCINFATNFVLATNSLDTSLPTDEVKVGCVALLCSLSFPPNFTPEPFGSLTEVNNALANGIVSYISGTAEQLALFFAGGTCNDCKIVEGVDLGGVTWAPATRPIPVEVCDDDEGDYYMYSPKRGKKGKKGKHMIC